MTSRTQTLDDGRVVPETATPVVTPSLWTDRSAEGLETSLALTAYMREWLARDWDGAVLDGELVKRERAFDTFGRWICSATYALYEDTRVVVKDSGEVVVGSEAVRIVGPDDEGVEGFVAIESGGHPAEHVDLVRKACLLLVDEVEKKVRAK